MLSRLWKLLLLVLGFVLSFCFSEQALQSFREPVTLAVLLAALFASLQIPHASLTRAETPHKWIMQYALLPVIGGGAYAVWAAAGFVGIVFYTLAVAVPIGFWDTGVQSRAYRRELALWATDQQTTKRIVQACLDGQEDVADTHVRNMSTHRD